MKMGFFFDDKELEVITNQAKTSQKKVVIQELNSSQRGCEYCPLQSRKERISTPCMPISGNVDGDLMIVAEAPGENEDIQGEALIGPAGQLLRKYLPSRDLDRIAFSNAIRCRPPENRDPAKQEIHCCSVYLEEDFDKHNYKAILGLGYQPLSKFTTDASITQITGLKFPVKIGSKVVWYYPTLHPSFVLRSGGDRSLNLPTFKADIKRFFKNVDKWPKPVIENPKPEDVICVYDEQEAYKLYNELKKGKVGLDIETAGLRPYEKGNRLLTCALSDGDLTFAWPIHHPRGPTDWGLDLFLKAANEKNWVAHNSAFELIWAQYYARQHKDYSPKWKPKSFEDSMACARIYQQRKDLLNLGIVSFLTFGINIKKLTDINTHNILIYPLEELLPYNGLDSWACLKVFQYKRQYVDDYNYDHIIGSVRSTVEMELMGLPIDRDESFRQKEYWSQRSEDARKVAHSLYEVKAFERERQQEFNIGSPEDVGIALVDYGRISLPKTSGGKIYSTDEAVLRSLPEQNPLVDQVLLYREAVKHNSTYVDPCLDAKEKYADGMLRPCYTVMLTHTLRRSSNGPNIQNFPKRKHRELRKQVIAPPGHVLLSCDEGQLEARIYAMASKDPVFCQSIIDKEDIHSYWLNFILDLYPDYIIRLREKVNQTDEIKVRKYGRDIIKTDFVFASLFGTTAANCSERTNIPFMIINETLEEFWGRYAIANKWLKNQRKIYNETGEIHTLTKRIRYGLVEGMEPINSPIQSSATDLVNDAEIELSDLAFELDDMYIHPRINIHDDLTFIVPDNDDKIEYYLREFIAPAMTRVRFDWQIVPLCVEAKIGYNWADGEEIAVITGDYVK